MKRPLLLWPLILALLLFALGGLYGGVAMLTDPSGASLGLDSVIHLLPVSNYVLPGLFLAVAFGLAPVVLAVALWARPNWPVFDRIFDWSGHHWAWTGCLVLVGATALWLTYEGLLIGMYPITYVTAFLGLVILFLAAVPSVRGHYARGR